MPRITDTKQKRAVRQRRIRAKVAGSSERPRLAVFRSNKYLSAQVIDDEKGTTLAAASSKDAKGDVHPAEYVGAEIAKRSLDKKVKRVAFDRGGYRYTGNIKKLADAARAAGLEF